MDGVLAGLILKGIVTGLILSVMLGPAFFLLLETSIKKGIRAAITFDAGVLTADIIYIIIAYLFIQQVEELSQGENNILIRIIGGTLFLVYGYITFSKKVQPMELKKELSGDTNAKDYWVLYIKGLLLNIANPLIIFYWFSVMAFGHSGSDYILSGWNMFLYLSVVLGTFWIIDVLKIFGAKKLRPFITMSLLASLNKIIGVILMAFGAFLVINSIVVWLRFYQ
ncbi:MAG: LysE family transporter [Brumimicrobium sp.]|nr:LysE family transporter [Brumimicrobium sp.]MCO5269652.1 LysE family translocator [Brumimicrobium sp.]